MSALWRGRHSRLLRHECFVSSSKTVLQPWVYHTVGITYVSTTTRYASSGANPGKGAPRLRALPMRIDADRHHQTATRHVLRGILRECTYFPDTFAASYVRQYVLARYQNYHVKAWERRNDPELGAKMEIWRRKGRQALYQMQRANAGDRKMLLKAISMAYGRVGKRRRVLMAKMLPAAKPAMSATETGDTIDGEDEDTSLLSEDSLLADLVSKAKLPTRPGSVQDESKRAVDNLPTQLHTLVESQIRASPPTTSHRNPKRLAPVIDELNSWHRPMPQVRVQNKLKQWYANLLSLVHPPLPEKDWYRLKGLATGATPFVAMKPRRKQLVSPPTALELVVQQGKVSKDFFRRDFAHNITPRYMRRIWAEVFAQCPLLEYSPSRDAWRVTWGCHAVHGNGHDAVSVPSRVMPDHEDSSDLASG